MAGWIDEWRGKKVFLFFKRSTSSPALLTRLSPCRLHAQKMMFPETGVCLLKLPPRGALYPSFTSKKCLQLPGPARGVVERGQGVSTHTIPKERGCLEQMSLIIHLSLTDGPQHSLGNP